MADDIDRAQDHIEREMQARLLSASRVKPIEPTTHCLNCGDPSLPGGRYCSRECAEDEEARVRALRRAGVK